MRIIDDRFVVIGKLKGICFELRVIIDVSNKVRKVFCQGLSLIFVQTESFIVKGQARGDIK